VAIGELNVFSLGLLPGASTQLEADAPWRRGT